MQPTNLEDLNVLRIRDDAVRLLAEVGFDIPSEMIRNRLGGEVAQRNGRFCLLPEQTEHFIEEIRSRFGSSGPDTAVAAVDKLTIVTSPLNTHWLDPTDGKAKPQTTRDVIRNTKLACQLTREGLIASGVVGVPQDVPPQLQFIMTHYLDCLYNPCGGGWCLVPEEHTLRYIFEIDEVMGFARHAGSQMVSPMKFEGPSVEMAVQYGGPDVLVSCGPMPTVGVTAPADWHAAWAQCVAENVGAYAMLRLCGLENVGMPGFRLFVPNPSAATTYFSSPQHLFALLSRGKVMDFFNLRGSWSEMLLVAAKAPDEQAAAEKTLGCLLGKLFGIGLLEGAGGLWMDEIFSPQQLLIDIEIKHMVEGVRADFADRGRDCVAMVQEGIAAGGFLAADLTLDTFRDFAWESKLFDLRPRGAWTGDHQTLLKSAARLAEVKADAYDYELTGDKRTALDAIVARARRELGA